MAGKRYIARRLWLLALGVACIALLADCGSSSALRGATPGASPTSVESVPTELHVVRFGGPAQNHVAPFDVQTDQADKVQRLFATLRALPSFVPTVSCPADQGGGYLLTFRDSKGVVAQAVIPAGGCLALDFSKPYGCHSFTDTTVDQVADTLGVQHTDLIRMAAFWDSAAPGGPTAPVEPSEPLLNFSPCH
jgi:hypothetical protein